MKHIVLSIMLLVSLVNANLLDSGLKKYNNDDKKGAISDFRKACDGGNIDGCYNLGLMYAHGDGIK